MEVEKYLKPFKGKESEEDIKDPIGFVTIHPRGFGIATIPGSAEQIRIDQDKLGTAFSGDKVRLKLDSKKRGGVRKGEVVKVEKSIQKKFVGAIEKIQGGQVRISSRRINRAHKDFELVDGLPNGVKPGSQVMLELVEWKSPNDAPKVRFVQTLGENGTFDAEMRAIPWEYGFADKFPNKVLKEAKQLARDYREITEEDIKEREDFREVTTFTIDPESAKDFDDAISFKKLSNGNYEIGVHIADPTHYIKPGSAIDFDAQKRGTSVYLPDRVIPMLPEELSNDLCSLNEGEDKRTFSAIFEIRRNGTIVESKTRFANTLINSNKRLTYQEAQKLIDKKTPFTLSALVRGQKKQPLEAELKELWDLTAKHREKRTGQDIDESRDRDELEFQFDKQGRPEQVTTKERFDTMKMIEELMLLANENAAKRMNGANTTPYRVHAEPNPEKIEDLRKYLIDIGVKPTWVKAWRPTFFDKITQADIDKLLINVKDTAEEKAIQRKVFGSMKKALYSTDNIGHFSLAMKDYAHFTSPIRRYADFILHRVLKDHLLNGAPITPEESRRYINATVTLTHRSQAADNAEKDAIELMQAELLRKKIGEPRRGRIDNIDSRGLHVIDRSTGTYGLLPARTLGPDWQFKEKPRRFVNTQNKKDVFSLQEGISITPQKVDLATRKVTWDLGPGGKEKRSTKKKPAK